MTEQPLDALALLGLQRTLDSATEPYMSIPGDPAWLIERVKRETSKEALAAKSPDLARAVIAQAAEIAKLQAMLAEKDEAQTAWLIERRVTPPQWATVCDPTGVGAFYSDIDRAHRFPTKDEASEAMRRMRVTPEERGQYFVSEHMWIGGRAFFGMDEQDFEDFLADAIDDSIDMDWTGRIGARAVMRKIAALQSGAASS